MDNVKRIAVTGGAGQIAYSLLFRIASGEIFGEKQKIALHILELPQALGALEGVVMELKDCAYPLLHEIIIGSDPVQVFRDIDVALLVGSKPRSPGMERKELILENAKIFVEQGKALNTSAKKDCLVFVVGNPCNTNCLIALHNAPDIPKGNFHAMTRLDQNRAQYQLAEKAGVDISEVSDVTIWGNHSATQVPDFVNAKIKGKKAPEVISDHEWLKTTFMTTVQKRGAEVLASRGKSSAASAANAILDGVKAIVNNTNHFSSARFSDGNPYGIQDGLMFSFPCHSKNQKVEIIPGITWDEFLKEKIKKSEEELLEERSMITHLL